MLYAVRGQRAAPSVFTLESGYQQMDSATGISTWVQCVPSSTDSNCQATSQYQVRFSSWRTEWAIGGEIDEILMRTPRGSM